MALANLPFVKRLIENEGKVIYGKNYDYVATYVKGTNKYMIKRRLTELDDWERYALVPDYIGIPSLDWELFDTIYSPITTDAGRIGARRQIYG